jgi:hypothetical protein
MALKGIAGFQNVLLSLPIHEMRGFALPDVPHHDILPCHKNKSNRTNQPSMGWDLQTCELK